ncbi:MAG: glycyl-radical enzyme activating protein [Oscillospiraceae bacterium]
MKLMKKGFNFSQDGTGNRLVYHLQGCNMRCPWCSNPEGISREGSFLIHKEKLIDSVCPHGNIRLGTIDRRFCDECAARECLNARRNQGIEFSCQELSVEELVSEAVESRPLFFGGGGLTFTGGEPTLQFDQLLLAAKELCTHGISLAIETNGTNPRLPLLFPYLDLLIMDFKHPDSEIHKKFTGVSNEQVKQNIEKAMNLHKNVLIRTPLINKFNAEKSVCGEFIEFYKQFPLENTRFELLKYHEYGRSKWELAGMEYKMTEGFVSEEIKPYFEAQYKANGLTLVNT